MNNKTIIPRSDPHCFFPRRFTVLAAMATCIPRHHGAQAPPSALLLPSRPTRNLRLFRPHAFPSPPLRRGPLRAFRRADFDGFAKRVASGDALRDAWRSANNGFEQLSYESRKFAERMDRQFSVSRRFESAARTTIERVRELDYELGIGRRWRTFSMDFSRNWPRVGTLTCNQIASI